jgi:hypothetical protein
MEKIEVLDRYQPEYVDAGFSEKGELPWWPKRGTEDVVGCSATWPNSVDMNGCV